MVLMNYNGYENRTIYHSFSRFWANSSHSFCDSTFCNVAHSPWFAVISILCCSFAHQVDFFCHFVYKLYYDDWFFHLSQFFVPFFTHTLVRRLPLHSKQSLTFHIDLFLVIASSAAAIAAPPGLWWHCRMLSFAHSQFKNGVWNWMTEWKNLSWIFHYILEFEIARCSFHFKRFFLAFLQCEKGNWERSRVRTQ